MVAGAEAVAAILRDGTSTQGGVQTLHPMHTCRNQPSRIGSAGSLFRIGSSDDTDNSGSRNNKRDLI